MPSEKTPVTADVHPYLKKVRIRDYAPLRDATVEFKPGLNIIIGPNGVGKTRFLELTSSLLELQEEHHIGLGSELTISGQYEIKVEFRDRERTTSPEKTAMSPRLAADAPKPLIIHATYGSKETKEITTILDVAISDFIKDPSFFYSVILVKHGIPVSGLPIVDESLEMFLDNRETTVQTKSGRKNPYKIESQFIQAITRIIVSIIRRGYGFPTPLMTTETARELIFAAIGKYMDSLSHYLPYYSPIQAVRCGNFFQVYHQDVPVQYTVKGLVLEFRIQENWLPFSALSDGTKRLFYVISELLTPKPASTADTIRRLQVEYEKKIIFLEEPELGIHPAQLTKLLNLIREVSRENQVILTTHSPQVLDILTKDELDRITLCELDPEKGTQFHKLSAEKQQQARTYMEEVGFLSDYWRYSYLEETTAE